MIDFAILKLIWWLFIGVLLAGFAIMDGQDMGVGTLLPFLGKTNEQRRIMINSVAPHWDGNQVWLLTGGGAMFAAWPIAYAAAFSGFYWALLAVLAMLIFRPVAFDYRGKVDSTSWRALWDILLFLGSSVPPVICGVAFGNLLQGVPIAIDDSMRITYQGNFFGLLNPFGILAGLVAITMIVMHGAIFLALRSVDELHGRAASVACGASLCTVALFVLAGLWTAFAIPAYEVLSGLDPAGQPNPLLKEVAVSTRSWVSRMSDVPGLFAFPFLGIAGALASFACARSGKWLAAIVCSGVSLLGIVFTPLVTMFPFVMPSTVNPRFSLTLWDCTSSQLTLEIMLFVTLIFLPLVLLYTGWAYRVMRGKVTPQFISENSHHLY